MASQVWGSDAPISMPEAPDKGQPVLVDFAGGFGMTTGGITHSLTETALEQMSTPFFAPPGAQ